MPRPRRDAAQLRAISGQHLRYEIEMFLILARALATGVFGKGALHNAVLESFIVKGRILLDFFFSGNPPPDESQSARKRNPPREDDVIAEDFFLEPEAWPKIRGGLPEDLKDLNRRVGKEIVHLTYTRLDVTPTEKVWQFAAIASAIEDLAVRFATHVPPEHLGIEWKSGD